MDMAPREAYVFQPDPPTKDGKFYAVGGLRVYGFEAGRITGLSLKDANSLVKFCKENPEFAASFCRGLVEKTEKAK